LLQVDGVDEEPSSVVKYQLRSNPRRGGGRMVVVPKQVVVAVLAQGRRGVTPISAKRPSTTARHVQHREVFHKRRSVETIISELITILRRNI